MGENGVLQRLAEFFRLAVGPFLTASGTGYPPGKDAPRLTFLQFRDMGLISNFTSQKDLRQIFITPMILFSLYEQFRIYFCYPIRSPIYTKALVNSSVCSVAPRPPQCAPVIGWAAAREHVHSRILSTSSCVSGSLVRSYSLVVRGTRQLRRRFGAHWIQGRDRRSRARPALPDDHARS
jgi:hypothetical protein